MPSEESFSSGFKLYVNATLNFLFSIKELIQNPSNCLLPIYSFKIFFQEEVVKKIILFDVKMKTKKFFR